MFQMQFTLAGWTGFSLIHYGSLNFIYAVNTTDIWSRTLILLKVEETPLEIIWDFLAFIKLNNKLQLVNLTTISGFFSYLWNLCKCMHRGKSLIWVLFSSYSLLLFLRVFQSVIRNMLSLSPAEQNHLNKINLSTT